MSKTKGALIGAGIGAIAGGAGNYFRKDKDKRSAKDALIGAGVGGAAGAGVGYLAGRNKTAPPVNAPKHEAPPVNAPKHETPPVNAPKHETPPANAPKHEAPVNAPPTKVKSNRNQQKLNIRSLESQKNQVKSGVKVRSRSKAKPYLHDNPEMAAKLKEKASVPPVRSPDSMERRNQIKDRLRKRVNLEGNARANGMARPRLEADFRTRSDAAYNSEKKRKPNIEPSGTHGEFNERLDGRIKALRDRLKLESGERAPKSLTEKAQQNQAKAKRNVAKAKAKAKAKAEDKRKLESGERAPRSLTEKAQQKEALRKAKTEKGE